MSFWRQRTRLPPPAMVVLRKVLSGEPEQITQYWVDGDKLYKKVGEDFVYIKTRSFAEFMASVNEGKS